MIVATWIVSLLCVTAAAYYGVPYALRRRQVHSLAARAARERIAVLTYDDGPGRRLTPALLALLASRGVRATFFSLGRRAAADPDTLDGVRAAGHEVGCHAYEHVSAWHSAPGRALRDARRGFRALERWIDGAGWFRPPHGKLDLGTLLWLRARGAGIAWWTLDAGDTWEKRPDPKYAAERLIAAGGGVVLLHDFDGTEEHDAFVLAATRALLDAAEGHGIRFRALGEWLAG
jgi:peptidoglycan/xylan/chitin deacetylase (PgdA/CDA1 family)